MKGAKMETTELYMKVRLALQMMEVEKELHTETADGTHPRSPLYKGKPGT